MFALLIVLSLALPPAQPAPPEPPPAPPLITAIWRTAAWETPGRLDVTWRGIGCVRKTRGTIFVWLTESCDPSINTIELTTGGADHLRNVAVGDVLTLENGQVVLASVTVPPRVTQLPVVVVSR